MSIQINENDYTNDYTQEKIQSPNLLIKDILIRNQLKKPDGRQLYKYQLTRSEYLLLQNSLKEYLDFFKSEYYFVYWAAGFCLYVSEWYRRDYNHSWSWDECDRRVGVSFSPSDHERIVNSGIVDFWHRNIKKSPALRRDFLGTLFFEGGLPWPLIKNDGHIFGNIVKKCLGDYFRFGETGYPIINIVYKQMRYLPTVFQNDESAALITNIVHSLIQVSVKFDFHDNHNPYEYVIQKSPEWKDSLPLPLDDETAQGLINEWLVDADKKKYDHKAERESSEFSCVHFQSSDLSGLSILTVVIYPTTHTIPVKVKDLKSTRFETVLYEGRTPISQEGSLYGKIEGSNISVQFKKRTSRIERQDIHNPLYLTFFSSGELIHKYELKDSNLGSEEVLTFAASKNDEGLYKFISDSSCLIKGENALVRVPQRSIIYPDNYKIIRDNNQVRWIEVNRSTTIKVGEDSFLIKLGQENGNEHFFLEGKRLQLQSDIGVCYLGVPTIPSHWHYSNNISVYLNQVLIQLVDINDFVGKNYISIKGEKNQIWLKKYIGVIPENFCYEITSNPASIEFFNIEKVRINVKANGVNVLRQANKFMFQTSRETSIPLTIRVIMKGDCSANAIALTLPYPQERAILTSELETPLNVQALHVTNLLGKRIQIFTPFRNSYIHITMELLSRNTSKTYKISHRYQCREFQIELNLFSLRDEIFNLFSIVADQDACIQLSIENDSARKLFSLDVTRYEGDVRWNSEAFTIQYRNTEQILHNAIPVALNMANPVQQVVLEQKLSEGVDTGVFEVPRELSYSGPWLIMPTEKSLIQFRPRLYFSVDGKQESNIDNDSVVDSIDDLAKVVKDFNGSNSEIFINVVSTMAKEFNHGGWKYLNGLIENSWHIQLSAFEVWRVIAHNFDALSAIVFRLNFDESMCEKIQDELAVLWDEIPLHSWCSACSLYRHFLQGTGLDDYYINATIEKKIDALASIIPVLNAHKQYIIKGSVEHVLNIPQVKYFLGEWVNKLRIDHKDDRYPEDFPFNLSLWKETSRTKGIISVLPSLEHYIELTTYLPFFMAEITSGYTLLDDFFENKNEAKFLIKQIIDFDRSWYDSVHALVVNYLHSEKKEN